MLGVIEALKPERGFGFIEGQDGAKYFLHVYNLVDRIEISALAVGQEVEFDAGDRNGKLCAFRIKVQDNAAV